MTKQFSMELAGRTLMVEVGRVAAQANGAAFMHYGDTVVLSTATASAKPREGIEKLSEFIKKAMNNKCSYQKKFHNSILPPIIQTKI